MNDILRRTWAEIDLDALSFNYRQIRKITSDKAEVCCVIKADAYGHGAVRIARALEDEGAGIFAVSNLEEALQLRRGGIQSRILVMGYTPADRAKSLSDNSISQCVFSYDYALELSENAKRAGCAVNIHIKVDSGMSRLGFYYQDISRDEKSIGEIISSCKLEGLVTEGIFTHFACADDGKQGDRFTMKQFGCFKDMIEALHRNGITFSTHHCANSSALLDYPLIHMDMVRAGLLLYGIMPSDKIRNRLEVRPVMSLKSVISQIREVYGETTISYGRAYTAHTHMKIATIPLGYADGYPRILSSRGAQVIINGRLCPIVGRICMDYLMADVTAAGDVHTEDTATLIGMDGSTEISANDVAGLMDTIGYEIICNIGKRVPRVYVKDKKVESVTNQILP